MRAFNILRLLSLAGAVVVQHDVYDVVIAGAGTAGMVVANRLSERSDITVAVIEPGDDVRQDPAVKTIEFAFANFNASINWQYLSVTQPELGSRNLSYRAGKAWGGTSSVNGMVYIRGDKAGYDAWEDLGNEGWNWESIFSYAKKGEQFVPPGKVQVAGGAKYDQEAHGEQGPLTVGFPSVISTSSFYNSARSTWKALGLAPIDDLNGGDPHGFAAAPQTLDPYTSTREDSARAYYGPVQARKNLFILKGTVKRITWATEHGKQAVANGVEYITASNQLAKVGVRKEVVLSASTFRNPLILEASGVGNPRILKKLGITTKVALPGVGENMQDHNAAGMSYALKTPISGHLPYAALPSARDVFGNETASFEASTSANLSEWARTASALSDGAISASAIEKRFRIQHDLIFKKNVTIAQLYPSNVANGLLAQFWTSLPFSLGSVHLASTEKINDPVITPNLFSTDFDIAMLAAVGRLSHKAYSTPPLSDLIAANTSPGYSTLPLDASDEQWAAYLKGSVSNALHTIGTCAMLPEGLGGVVDTQLRVYGTRNVRVVDASVIPMPLSGHATGPIYAVAEKASDLIKASW